MGDCIVMGDTDISQIDALKRANEELRAAAERHATRSHRFARLRGLTARLAASLDRTALFDEIVHAAADLLECRGAALLLLDDDERSLHVEAGQGLESAGNHRLPLERSVANHALETRRTIAVEDTTAMPRTVIPTLANGLPPGALIVAPIRVEGNPFGVVEVYFAAPRAIPQEDVEMLDALSDAAAIALRNATAYARILEQGSELARRNNELRRASVLKDQFLSTMSHELRTPLTTIVGFSALLLRERHGETLGERQHDNAQRILAAARHLVTLINDILDLSRIEAGRLDIFRRAFSLPDLLDELQAEMEPRALAKGLTFSVEVGVELERVVADTDRLRQILINLSSNAIKFTFVGGVTVRAERGGDAIAISVKDTGIGIPPQEQEHIFEDFYQVDQSSTRAAGGTGLGLAISRRLVKLLDGQLTLHSVPGAGSVFTVVLPAEPAAHAIVAPPQAGRHAPMAGQGHLLVIDDDPNVALFLERTLEGTAYTVSGALSADEGLAKARDLRPDVVLLDVMMPETDGWRALHRLKSDPRTAHIPVVMHTIVADQALGFSLGAADYLVKPVEREQLLTALHRLVPDDAGPVLVVDDDPDIRTLLATLLTEEHIPVMLAADGDEALRLAEQRVPRLVLLDLLMPGLNGFTVLQRLRADPRTRHIPIVVITAKTLTPQEEQLLSHEASAVVTKSAVPLERLLEEIRGALQVTL